MLKGTIPLPDLSKLPLTTHTAHEWVDNEPEELDAMTREEREAYFEDKAEHEAEKAKKTAGRRRSG